MRFLAGMKASSACRFTSFISTTAAQATPSKFFRNSEQTIFKTLGTYKIDLVWGGGDYLFENQLKYFTDENKDRRPGCLEPYPRCRMR